MKRALLLAVVLLGVWAPGAAAVHRAKLEASPTLHRWQATPRYSRGEIALSVYVEGQRMDSRIQPLSVACKALLQTKNLSLTLNACGHRFSARYLGSARFTLVYWFLPAQ